MGSHAQCAFFIQGLRWRPEGKYKPICHSKVTANSHYRPSMVIGEGQKTSVCTSS